MKGFFSNFMGKFQDKNENNNNQSENSQNNNNENKNTNNKNNNEINLNNSTNSNQNNNNNNNNNNNIKKEEAHKVVVINDSSLNKKKGGFYYKKHIDSIIKLKVSDPMIIQRQKMKINFDTDIITYLFNDMTAIFKDKSSLIDKNQKELVEKINQTHNLVNVLNEINSNSEENIIRFNKEKEIKNNIDLLESFIKNLSNQVEELEKDFDNIEKLIKNKK